MKTILYTIIIGWTILVSGQNKPEFYFNLDLGNHINEQLFHVNANSNNFQFALVGVIEEGNKQLFANRYTLKKIKFLIRNFLHTPQKIKLDKVIFNIEEMTNNRTHLSVYASKDNTSQKGKDEWYELDLGKIGLRKTIVDITMFYDENGDGDYTEMNAEKGFGDHICKSRITF